MAKSNSKPDPRQMDVEEVTGTAVAVRETGSSVAAIPDYLRDYQGPIGTENIDSDDIVIPRIKVGQDMSDEVQSGDLERGDLFLNLDGTKLAGPGEKLPFILLSQYKEYILWRPRKDNGGGILARALKVKVGDEFKYEWDKPNKTFDVKIEGKVAVKWTTGKFVEDDGLGEWGSEIPGDAESGIAATAHHNYVVYLPTLGMVAGLSLERSKAKKAKAFNAMLKMGRAPVWARVFTLETFEDHADDDKFYNVNIKPNGFVPEAQSQEMKEMFEDFRGKTVVVDQSDGGDSTVTDERE